MAKTLERLSRKPLAQIKPLEAGRRMIVERRTVDAKTLEDPVALTVEGVKYLAIAGLDEDENAVRAEELATDVAERLNSDPVFESVFEGELAAEIERQLNQGSPAFADRLEHLLAESVGDEDEDVPKQLVTPTSHTNDLHATHGYVCLRFTQKTRITEACLTAYATNGAGRVLVGFGVDSGEHDLVRCFHRSHDSEEKEIELSLTALVGLLMMVGDVMRFDIKEDANADTVGFTATVLGELAPSDPLDPSDDQGDDHPVENERGEPWKPGDGAKWKPSTDDDDGELEPGAGGPDGLHRPLVSLAFLLSLGGSLLACDVGAGSVVPSELRNAVCVLDAVPEGLAVLDDAVADARTQAAKVSSGEPLQPEDVDGTTQLVNVASVIGVCLSKVGAK